MLGDQFIPKYFELGGQCEVGRGIIRGGAKLLVELLELFHLSLHLTGLNLRFEQVLLHDFVPLALF